MKLPSHIRRIALICSGLEEGRNGVGDYCRQLARALAGQGVSCDLLALNDPAVADVAETALDSGTIRIARIPAAYGHGRKAGIAGAILVRWRPDWVSLQFVCHGFDPRGIVWRELGWLPPLLKDYPLEVMMHELWIGHRPRDPLRERLIGALQRRVILRLIRRLHPRRVHTSNAFYRRMLGRSGVPAGVLPLFGNIPVGDEKAAWLATTLGAACGCDVEREPVWVFGMFGGIWAGWNTAALFDRISAVADRAGRVVIVAAVGHAGDQAPATVARWQARHPRLRFALLGPRPASEVSQFLNTVDFGLTSYPINLLGKSGAVSAMLEHGLPVIAAWGDTAPELPSVSPPFADLVWRNDDALEDRLGAGRPPRARSADMREFVASRLIEDLTRAADEAETQ